MSTIFHKFMYLVNFVNVIGGRKSSKYCQRSLWLAPEDISIHEQASKMKGGGFLHLIMRWLISGKGNESLREPD